eukprot:scaffold115167_cov22-Prasinocladus_malaysianus.AAC.1
MRGRVAAHRFDCTPVSLRGGDHGVHVKLALIPGPPGSRALGFLLPLGLPKAQYTKPFQSATRVCASMLRRDKVKKKQEESIAFHRSVPMVNITR